MRTARNKKIKNEMITNNRNNETGNRKEKKQSKIKQTNQKMR